MDSPCWQILAKAPVERNVLGAANPAGWNGAIWNGVDVDTMRMSLRSFLEDRFKLAAHLEDRMIPRRSYSETADSPALSAAFDLAIAHQRCRSFRHLVTVFGQLVVALGATLPAPWPPADWAP